MSRVVTFSLRGGLQRGDCTPCLGVRSKLIPTKIDPTLVVQAASVAAQWHSTQRRKGASQEPYINHLLEVAALVAAGGGDQPTVIAALLHDAIEDQKISPDTIAAQFGEYVAAIVLEVTDDKSLSKAERKAIQIATASHKSHSAKLIKLADKISNVRAVATSPPVDWSEQRRREYIEFCTAVVNECRGTSTVLEYEFDAARERGFPSVAN
jgi:(p)ppGpp synthase/HD superfamily hydrolase